MKASNISADESEAKPGDIFCRVTYKCESDYMLFAAIDSNSYNFFSVLDGIKYFSSPRPLEACLQNIAEHGWTKVHKITLECT